MRGRVGTIRFAIAVSGAHVHLATISVMSSACS